LSRPPDLCPDDKLPVLDNVRSVIAGTLTARSGLVALTGSVPSRVHSLYRYDDAGPGGTSHPSLIVVGAGGVLYWGTPSGGWTTLDIGYSGDRLSFFPITPPQSPSTWLYVGDRNRTRKINSALTVYQLGIAPPSSPPVTALSDLERTVIENFTNPTTMWASIGAQAAPLLPTGARVNESIHQILYDSGSTGWASIVPGVMTGIEEGMLLQVGDTEEVPVQQVCLQVVPTTIAAILYDSGSTGMCTIQPAASLGTGMIEAPPPADYRRRYIPPTDLAAFRASLPPDPSTASALPASIRTPGVVPRIRQMDFPVNCVIQIGSEVVRILSVAPGRDGVQSFRCRTSSTHTPGEPITGFGSFRVYLQGTWGFGAHLYDLSLSNIITPILQPAVSPNPQATAGIRTIQGWVPRNLAAVGSRATMPDDDLHLSIKVNYCPLIKTVRLYLSTEPTASTFPAPTDFTSQYFFFEWRQSDIVAAIQMTNADRVDSLQDARTTVVTNEILNAPNPFPPRSVYSRLFNRLGLVQGTLPGQTGLRPPYPIEVDPPAISQQLALGNNQWLDLRCKVRQLIQVGTDPSHTLANVTAAEVLLDVEGGAAVQVSYDAIWLSGGYGPDVGQLGAPYVCSYRYRSSITGTIGNPSPPTRCGLFPHRQRLTLTGVSSADPQVDTIEFFLLGGTLSEWTYVGSAPNSNPTLLYDLPDSEVVGGTTLTYDRFAPWPVGDLPRRGTCDVAGTAIQWVSGDRFDTRWAPGSPIIVNGQTHLLYSSPASTTRLFIAESAGSGQNVPFILPAATIQGQSLPAAFGGAFGGLQATFAVGDARHPGSVMYTNINDTEAVSDANFILVTPDSEPLQNGYVWDGLPYVASTEHQYLLEPTPGQPVPFRPLVTPCGRGLWTRWAFCLGPEGVYFLSKDGIYLTSGGSAAQSITDEDLYPLFPHEGQDGQEVNGFFPPDMTATSDLSLSYVDGHVFFDYLDTQGTPRSLTYRVRDRSWWPSRYVPGVCSRFAGLGDEVHQALIGGGDGVVYKAGGNADDGHPFECLVQLTDTGGDTRRQKVYRDFWLDASRADQVTVNLGMSNNSLEVGTSVLPIGVGPQAVPATRREPPVARDQSPVDTAHQTGSFGTSLTATLRWTPAGAFPTVLYSWDAAFQPAPELASSWLSGPTTHGGRGYQYPSRALIAYLSNVPVDLSVLIDGAVTVYHLPTTGGVYAKNPVVLAPKKGLAFQYGVTGVGGAFMLFDQDCEIWLSQWGAQDGPQVIRPF